MKISFRPIYVAIAMGLVLTRPADADIVTDWNSQILSAIDAMGTESPYAARNLALMHTAVYNAIESVTHQYQIYSYSSYTGPTGSAPLGTDIGAAATSAAYTVMQSLFPTLAGPGGALETQYSTHLTALGNSQAVADGLAWGSSVANELITWRSGDGSAGAQSPYNSSNLGHWQPTDPNVQQPLYPSWGDVTPFAIASASSFLPSTPAAYDPGDPSTITLSAVLNAAPNATLIGYLTTATYAADYNQVKDLGGSQNSGVRTADQTDTAYFWDAGVGTVTQPGMWNNIATDVAGAFNYSLEENARLLAALNVSLADVGISAFKAIYQTDLWRPQTAIEYESDPFSPNIDNNPLTGADPLWTPLIASRNSPEYLSSQAAFAAAAGAVLANFFGDATAFAADSDIFGNGSVVLTRNYTSFSQASSEAGLAGVYSGNHFATSVTDAQAVGAALGNSVLAGNFTPVPEPSGAILMASIGFTMLLRRRRW